MGARNWLVHAVGFSVRMLPEKKRVNCAARITQNFIKEFPQISSVSTPCGDFQLSHSFLGRNSEEEAYYVPQGEPETIRWIRDYIKDEERLWDIGANIGFFSLCAAVRNARVYAFEPFARSFMSLVKNVELNNMQERITPCCIALADKTAHGRFYVGGEDLAYQGARNFTSEGSTPPKGAKKEHSAFAVTVDSFRQTFKLPPPHHIKLDVDGLEIEILKGAKETLPHVRSIMIEVELEVKDRAQAELLPLLEERGFVEKTLQGKTTGRNRLFVNSRHAA